MQNDSRNLIIFMVVAMVLLWGYEQFVLQPIQQRQQAAAQAQQAAAAAAQKSGVTLAPNGQPVVTFQSRAQALAATPRVALQTPSLTGSISLKSALMALALPPALRTSSTAESAPDELCE